MSPPHTEHPSSHAHLGSALASEPKSGRHDGGDESIRRPRARDDVAALARVRATYRVAAAPGREIRHRVHPRSRALIQNLVPRRPRVLGARRHRRAAARGDGGVKRHRRRRGALPLHRRLRQRGVAVLLAVRERADGLPDRVRRGRRRRRRCDMRRAPSPLPLPAAARLVPPARVQLRLARRHRLRVRARAQRRLRLGQRLHRRRERRGGRGGHRRARVRRRRHRRRPPREHPLEGNCPYEAMSGWSSKASEAELKGVDGGD
eukprot:31523-Pelagococcus_subviridis.AAC.9